MGDLDKMLTDATCYESEVRFPTNQKLLWESVQWNYKQMESLCRLLKIKTPRTKYLDWIKPYNKYSKKKKNNQNTAQKLLEDYSNYYTNSMVNLAVLKNKIVPSQDKIQEATLDYKESLQTAKSNIYNRQKCSG